MPSPPARFTPFFWLLLVALLGASLFVFIAWSVMSEGALVAFDHACVRQLRDHAAAYPLILGFFRLITLLGGPWALFLFDTTGVILLWRYRHRNLALLWGVAAMSGALLNVALKETFDRPRPALEFRDTAARETNESFPSGHSMGALLAYGTAACIGWRLWPRCGPRALLVTGATVLVLLVGFSRMYLRAHYCSDVLGAFAIAGSWLCLCLAAYRWAETRHVHKSSSTTPFLNHGDDDDFGNSGGA